MSKRAQEHDKWLGILHSAARAEELDRKDSKDYVPEKEDKKCTNCNTAVNCKRLKAKTSYSGSYSIGGDSDIVTCEKWTQKKSKNVQKQANEIKGLMKQFKRNLRN